MRLCTVLDTAATGTLDAVLGTIYDVYLSKREKTLYSMLCLSLAGKPQCQLSILFSMQQDKVSIFMRRLKIKMKRVYITLTTKHEELRELNDYLSTELFKPQMAVVELLLLGNKKIRVASILGKSPANITLRLRKVYQSLPPQRTEQLKKFINALR